MLIEWLVLSDWNLRNGYFITGFILLFVSLANCKFSAQVKEIHVRLREILCFTARATLRILYFTPFWIDVSIAVQQNQQIKISIKQSIEGIFFFSSNRQTNICVMRIACILYYCPTVASKQRHQIKKKIES